MLHLLVRPLYFVSLLVLVYLILNVEACPHQGAVSIAPESNTIPVGSNATFSCRSSSGTIRWQVNRIQIHNTSGTIGQSMQYLIRTDMCNVSTIVLTPSTILVNGTRLKCLVIHDLNDNTKGEESEFVHLYLYEHPLPPSNLEITRSGVDLSLSWEAPFSLDGENITYIVRATNTRSGESRELESDSPQLVFSESIGERDCSLYEFRVYSVNPVGRSTTSEIHKLRIPTKPLMFDTGSVDAVSLNVDFNDGLSVTLTFEAPHPCNEYSVHAYNLTFQDEQSSDHAVTFTRQNDHDRVTIEILNSQDDSDVILQRNRIYLVTIVAINEVGSTVSGEITVYTTGLQSSSVVLEVNDTASVTCNFALGSDALGCEVSFYASTSMELLFGQNITRELSSGNTLTKNIPLMGSLNGSTVNITVLTSEWLADGSVSSVEIEAQVTYEPPIPETETVQMVTTAYLNPESTTAPAVPTTHNSRDISNQYDSVDLLYIIVGSVVGVLVVGICFVSILLVLVCLKRRRRKMTDFVGTQNVSTHNTAYGVCTADTGYNDVYSHDPYYDEIRLSKQKLDSEHYEEIPAAMNGTLKGAGNTAASRNKIAPGGSTQHMLSVPNPIYNGGLTQFYNGGSHGQLPGGGGSSVSVTNPVYHSGAAAGGRVIRAGHPGVCALAKSCETLQRQPSNDDDVYIVMQPNGRAEVAARYTTIPHSGTFPSLFDEAAV